MPPRLSYERKRALRQVLAVTVLGLCMGGARLVLAEERCAGSAGVQWEVSRHQAELHLVERRVRHNLQVPRR